MRRHPERDEQEAVKRLLIAIGAKFYIAGTTRKRGDHQGTMQTPGLADMPLVFLPRYKRAGLDRPDDGGYPETMYELVVIEMKSPTAAKAKSGGLSTVQAELKHYCQMAGVPYIHGDATAVVQWLIDHAYLRADQVAHYYAVQ